MCGGLPRPCGLRTRPAIRLGLLPFLRSQLARGQPSPGRLGCLFFLSMAPQAHGPYLLPHLGLDLFGHPSCSLAKETIPGPSWSRFLLSRPFPGFRPALPAWRGQGFGPREPGPLPSPPSPGAELGPCPEERGGGEFPLAGSLSVLLLCRQESSPGWSPSPRGARGGPPGLHVL